MTSPTTFRLRGYSVDAAGAQLSGGALAQGQRVSVWGTLRDGVLRASRISVQTAAGGEFDLRGAIASVDAGAKTFRFNGRRETVSYARTDVVFDGGDAGALQPGRPVRARGSLSADGARLEATRIEFLR
jgi:hypothetical protein